MTIPKIIHTTAPANETSWHPKWRKCYESWFMQFDSREFQHIMWSDEACEKLVHDHYPNLHDSYIDLPHNIMKLDIARLLILHKYGGIYHDMDYYVYNNFFNYLESLFKNNSNKKHKLLFGSSKKGIAHEIVSNFIIVSEKNCFLLYLLASMCLSVIDKFKNTEFYEVIKTNKNPNVSALTGPLITSNFLLMCVDLKNKIDYKDYLLNYNLFNPDYSSDQVTSENIPLFEKKVYGKHLGTATWI